MYKKILWFMVSILVVSLGIFVTIIYFDINDISFSEEDKASPDLDVEEVVKVGHEDLEEIKEMKYVNPFYEEYRQDELLGSHYQDYIHKMSHQKVIADTKWGFYKITEERIDWLLESLEANYDYLDEGKVYKEILTKWKNGDFSSIDQDHNVIWKLQGGSIGEATGILSAEEEKEYIENTQEKKGKSE